MIRVDSWNSGLEDNVIRPIAQLAVERYGAAMLKKLSEKEMNLIRDDNAVRKIEVVINGYKVRMIRNTVLNRDFHRAMYPEAKDAEYMINIEVGVPSGGRIRWYVGIYYVMQGGKWVDETTLKELTTYE